MNLRFKYIYNWAKRRHCSPRARFIAEIYLKILLQHKLKYCNGTGIYLKSIENFSLAQVEILLWDRDLFENEAKVEIL